LSVPEPFSPRQLTDALLQPVRVGDDLLAHVVPIPEVLAALAVPRSGSGLLRLTDHNVHLALDTADRTRPGTPFRWSARTSRRALGLSAVRSLIAGDVRSPTEGVRSAMARAVRINEGERPTSAMDGWLAGLPPAGRAAVGAEAVTWATRLWTALDWSAFPTPPIIGRDHWWDSPHSSLLALRSRAEVRAVVPGDGRSQSGDTASVNLVVLGGRRRPTVRSELCVVALIEALRARREPPPGRIVGWWPDSGHFVRVEVDHAALDEGVTAVARTLAATETARPLQAGQTEAAA
jgi:hypothetical protein